MLISQFMGRLAEGQSCTQDIRHFFQNKRVRPQRDQHRRIQFNSILFYSDVRSRSV
jgi:hypothetical protein